MKSMVTLFFEAWLTQMERAYQNLTKKEFRALEDKIRFEIAFHRKRKR